MPFRLYVFFCYILFLSDGVHNIGKNQGQMLFN